MKSFAKRLLRGSARIPFYRTMSVSSKEEFEKSVKLLSSLKADPGNETKLQLYALYKQATVGKCNIPKPGLMDFAGKMKWEAWSGLQDMTQSQAQTNYVEIVKKLLNLKSENKSSEDNEPEVVTKIVGKVHTITINRAKRKNALTTEMYDMISDSLEKAGESDAAVTVVTGTGDFYSSGNDLANTLRADPSNYEQYAKMGGELLKRFVSTFINFPKPLIALVNGPAIGIMVTTLPLFDGVFASDRATFHTPFSSLAMSPEGCSSFTFPLIMGHTKACGMLLFDRKLSAYEAKDIGLVTEVFPSLSFHEEAWSKVNEISELPTEGLKLSKCLIRENFKKTLHEVNEEECKLLVSRWMSQEFKDTIFNLLQKKSRL